MTAEISNIPDTVSFTITLPEKCASQGININLEYFNELKEILKTVSTNFCYVMELTKLGIPHFHGMIDFNRHFIGRLQGMKGLNIKFYKYMKAHGFGFTKLDIMKNSVGWVDYIIKDYEDTSDYILDCVAPHKPDCTITLLYHIEEVFSRDIYNDFKEKIYSIVKKYSQMYII